MIERGAIVNALATSPHFPQWCFADDDDETLMRRHLDDGVNVTCVLHDVPRRPADVRYAASTLLFGLRLVSRPWHRPDVIVNQSPALLGSNAASMRATGGRRRPALGSVTQDLYSAAIVETADRGPTAANALSAIEKWTLRRADGIVAIHPRLESRMVQQLGVALAEAASLDVYAGLVTRVVRGDVREIKI